MKGVFVLLHFIIVLVDTMCRRQLNKEICLSQQKDQGLQLHTKKTTL
jgi:hypothetical protein